MMTPVDIWSEGTRMSADLFVPDDVEPGGRRPTILLCHGWAGPKSHLSRTYAPFFCKAGLICLTFDYRGWYDSDARIALESRQPVPDADGRVSVRGRPVREVVDPLDQNRDICNCMHWLLAQDCVDPERFGLWGSSFGGGHVIHVAGHDARVKAVVSQVPGMGQAPDTRGFTHMGPEGQRVGAAMARGEMTQVPRPAGMPDSLKGAGDARTLWLYQPRREHPRADADHRPGTRGVWRSREFRSRGKECDPAGHDRRLPGVSGQPLRHLRPELPPERGTCAGLVPPVSLTP
jgi:dienelactone hydrolase